MNYLAHAYLSFDQPEILLGNMMNDFVKGRKANLYSDQVQKGIRLHRSIDSFTDAHPVIKELKKLFQPKYGLYAAVFSDIVLDYFLANDRQYFVDEHSLKSFARKAYELLQLQIPIAPEQFAHVFHYMKTQDWLYNYRFEEGMRQSFNGMVRRAKYMQDAEPAFKIFKSEKSNIQLLYDNFFPDLRLHAHETLQQLLKAD